MLHAVPSIYWGLGGTIGLDTLGGTIEELARDRDPTIVLIVWIASLAKIFGALLALALVRPWGQQLPRRLLHALAGGGGLFLSVYGGVLMVGGLLSVTGLVQPASGMNRTAVLGHLLLWDPLFLIWGICLVAAWRQSRRAERERQLPPASEREDRQPDSHLRF